MLKLMAIRWTGRDDT